MQRFFFPCPEPSSLHSILLLFVKSVSSLYEFLSHNITHVHEVIEAFFQCVVHCRAVCKRVWDISPCIRKEARLDWLSNFYLP